MDFQGHAPYRFHKERRGTWVLDRTLGSGGFGTVDLWKNEETNEHLAIKRIRLKSELTEKHKQRWTMEVEIMLRLDHDNVVRAQPIPPELDVREGDFPMMAMEFCSRGDLRKVLMKPENCCGLPENQVRSLLMDVGAGLEYLHKNRIVHRDLKPDNIVLQEAEEKIVYKIIDLGYAKDLDQGSALTSFVGTLQYLAPELLLNQTYTCTVDYWSLGITAFECIAGYRPFLPHLQPVQCHRYIEKKKPQDICIYQDVNGQITFSPRIPPPCHLISETKERLEHWLRVMMQFDPKARGGANQKGVRPKCFQILQDILDAKMVNVLHVKSNKMVSFPLHNKVTVAELKSALQQTFSIPPTQQELLLASGISPDPTKPAVQCCVEPSEEEEGIVFLFSHQEELSPLSLSPPHMPERVAYMIRDPTTLFSYLDQKRAWAQSVHMCQDMAREYQRLLHAQRAVMLSLLRNNSQFVKLKSQLSIQREQLRAKLDFFNQSLAFDLEKYKEQALSGGVGSEKMATAWEKTKKDVQQYDTFLDQQGELYAQSEAMSTRINELNRSPYCRSKTQDVLGDLKKKAIGLYQKLIETKKENRHQNSDNKPMIDCVILCVSSRERLTPDLSMHISKVSACISDLLLLIGKLETSLKETESFCRSLHQQQLSRQRGLWKLVSVALQHHSPQGTSPPILAPLSPSAGIDVLDKSAEESMLIMSKAQSSRQKLRTMLSAVETSPLESQLDWNFLSHSASQLRWQNTDESMRI